MNDANDEIVRQYDEAFGERHPISGRGSFVISCDLCGALVAQEERMNHAKWHAAIKAALQ